MADATATTDTDAAAAETSSDSTDTTATATAAEKTEQVEGYDALGDAGKQALDRMKAERDAALLAAKAADPKVVERLKADKQALAKANQELAEIRAKFEGKETEYAAEQAKREVEQAALAKANDRIRRSEVKAAAKGVLADPQDAYKFLDLDSIEVDDDGNVDEAGIAKALADLVAEKPYLSAQGGQRFQGTADGGARKDAGKPSQLSKADVERLSKERKYAEIEQARQEGRLADYLGS